MDEQQTEILSHIWQLLVRGGADRRSPLHTPVVATLMPGGLPDARVMVLRKAEPTPATLRFHTDSRSPKCAELHGQPVTILGYHAPEAMQLRIHGRGVVETEGPVVDAAWAASSLFARRCYLATQPPGTILRSPGSNLPAEIEGQQPSDAQIAPARQNFALVHIHIDRIDWLHLANSGHRRARFIRNAPDSIAPDSIAPDSIAPDSIAPDSIAPDSIAPNWTVPDWTVPDWTAEWLAP